MNRTSINKVIKKRPCWDWKEGQRCKMGWPQTHRQWLNTRRDTLVAEVTPEEGGVPPHTGLPSPGVLYQEEEFPQHLPNQVRWKVAKNTNALLKGLHTDFLAYKHSPGLWWRGSNSRGTRDIPVKVELCGFRAKAKGTATIIGWGAFLICSLQEDNIFSMLSPLPKGQIWDHVRLINSIHVHHLGDVLGLSLTELVLHHPGHSRQLSSQPCPTSCIKLLQ